MCEFQGSFIHNSQDPEMTPLSNMWVDKWDMFIEWNSIPQKKEWRAEILSERNHLKEYLLNDSVYVKF